MDEPQLKRTLGIPEATFALVGFVVGMGPFIIPGEFAPQTGPGLFIPFLIAGVLAIFSCVVAAQIGGLFPISGAGYIGTSRVISPFAGFMLVWMIMMMMVVGMPILGYGFADYLAYFIPGLPSPVVAAGAIACFGLVNLTGVKATVAIQAVLVSLLLLVLLVFDVGGLLHVKPELMRPLAPNGIAPLLVAAIPAYYAFAGVMVIVEMGDEIRDPARTVPVTLALTFVIVLALYLMTCVALTGLLPYGEMKGIAAPLVRASEVFLPAWCSKFIALSALFGAAVAINGWFMTQTRDIYALARDRILPSALAHVNVRHGEPDAAVIFAIVIAVSGVTLGASLKDYMIMVVLSLFVVQIMIGLVVVLAPRRVPERFARSPIRLGPAARIFFGGGFALFSAVFAVLGALDSPRAAGVFSLMLGIGAVYYFLRRAALERRGVSIGDILQQGLTRLDESAKNAE